MERKISPMREDRVIYQGVVRAAYAKYSPDRILDPKHVCVILKKNWWPGIPENKIFDVKEVPVDELEVYYNDRIRAVYRSQLFQVDRVCYDTMEVRIFTGDFRGSLVREMEQIGISGIPSSDGMIYMEMVSLYEFVKIERERYDHFTKERKKELISPNALWRYLLEVRDVAP